MEGLVPQGTLKDPKVLENVTSPHVTQLETQPYICFQTTCSAIHLGVRCLTLSI